MTPKRLAIQFAVVNLIHCRLTPTQPFSERLPTYKKVAYLVVVHLNFQYKIGERVTSSS
ncbi:MAG: hypothetical protein LBK82_11190 [Planctomycetaceae bacterium]|nr:hypothetical protein [Planctomycetaceae bacterium]